jgi:hypothetical protein
MRAESKFKLGQNIDVVSTATGKSLGQVNPSDLIREITTTD